MANSAAPGADSPGLTQRGDLLCAASIGVYFLFVQTIWQTRGRFEPGSLVVLTLVLGCLPWLAKHLSEVRTGKLTSIMAVVACSFVLAELFAGEHLLYAHAPPRPWARAIAPIAFGLLAAGWVARSRHVGFVLFAAAAVAFAAFLAIELRGSPNPVMDVWSINTEATQALLDGENPYKLVYSDIYKQAGQPGYGYEPRYIYLPGLLLHLAPVVAIGLDPRWTSLLAITAGLLMTAWHLRRSGGNARLSILCLPAVSACIIFWFHGGQVFLLEQAWPECLILAYIVLAALTWYRAPWAAGVALTLALTLKQTTWFCAPFLVALAIKQRRWRLIAGVAAGVGVLTLPFFLWHPGAFFQNVVMDLLLKAPRPDGLSWAAVLLRTYPTASPLATAVSVLLYGGAVWRLVVILRESRGEAALRATIMWSALGMFGLFLFLKQSFYNYYYLVAGLLSLYAALGAQEQSDCFRRDGGAPGEQSAWQSTAVGRHRLG